MGDPGREQRLLKAIYPQLSACLSHTTHVVHRRLDKAQHHAFIDTEPDQPAEELQQPCLVRPGRIDRLPAHITARGSSSILDVSPASYPFPTRRRRLLLSVTAAHPLHRNVTRVNGDDDRPRVSSWTLALAFAW